MNNTACLQEDAQVLYSPGPLCSSIMYFKMIFFFLRRSEKDDKLELLQIKDMNIVYRQVILKKILLVVLFNASCT